MAQAGRLALSFDIQGAEELVKVMRLRSARIKDLRPAWNQIADDFRRRERELFERQGSVDGGPQWQAISSEWEEYKRKRGWDTRVLIQKGHLMRSLTGKTGGSIEIKEPMWMEIGTWVPYAHYHHERGRQGRLAKREPIKVSKAQRSYWQSVITKFVHESGQDLPTSGYYKGKRSWRFAPMTSYPD